MTRLTVFEARIKELERKELEQKRIERENKRRVERKNRDAFRVSIWDHLYSALYFSLCGSKQI